MRKMNTFFVLIFSLLVLLVLTSIYALLQGPAGSWLNPGSGLDAATLKVLMVQLRMPRIGLAIVTGAALALSGTVLQAILRNPLADPFVLGTSAGAATLTVLASVMGFSGGLVLLGSGFGGALVSLLLVMGIAGVRGRYPVFRLVVAGIIVHSFFSAIMMILMTVYADKISGVMLWLMGSLENKTPLSVLIALVVVVISYGYVQFRAQELNLISLGDDMALTSGVDVPRLKLELLLVTALMTGTVVALSGIIGFVGVIVPHAVRMMIGANHRFLLLAAGLGGAFFLLIADTLVRLFFSGYGLPVGVVTTLAGAPFFVYLLMNKGKEA